MFFKKIREKYNNLSNTQKIIANSLLNDYSKCAFSSIKEFSDLLNVSSASIYRFSCKLGYKGYPEFQKAVQYELQKELKPMKALTNSIEDPNNEINILKAAVDMNINVLKNMYNEFTYQNFALVNDKIVRARKIYIFGLRSTFCTAYYFYFMLKQFMDNITLLTLGYGDVYDNLRKINEKDLIFFISFPPYTKEIIELLGYAKEKKTCTVGVTDSKVSPLALNADIPIIAKQGSKTYSFVSVMTILNAIVIAVGKKNKNKTIQLLKENQKYLTEKRVYYNINKKRR